MTDSTSRAAAVDVGAALGAAPERSAISGRPSDSGGRPRDMSRTTRRFPGLARLTAERRPLIALRQLRLKPTTPAPALIAAQSPRSSSSTRLTSASRERRTASALSFAVARSQAADSSAFRRSTRSP